MCQTLRRSFLKTCLGAVAAAPLVGFRGRALDAGEELSDTIAPAGSGQTVLGKVAPRPSVSIHASPLGVGFETLDRRMFDPERTYPCLAQLGAKWARVQTGWARCETAPGKYDFTWLDKVVDSLRRIGIQPWFNLGYGNRLYTPDATNDFAVGWVPLWNEEALKAWLRFTRALGEHFGQRVKHWEIWNEPNISNFWKPRKSDPAEYVRFVRLTAPVIRQAVPGAVLVGPAVHGMEFFTRCLDSGLGDLVDKMSHHWYGPVPEAKYEFEINAIRDLLARRGLKQPLWQGESGCPSKSGGTGALATYEWTEARQARWAVRRTMNDLRLRIELTSYFHTVDVLYPNEDGTPNGRMNYKGLLRGDDYTPKPSYYAYQCLCALFDAGTCRAELPMEFPARDAGEILSAGFVRGGKAIYAYWLPADLREQMQPRPIELRIPAAKEAGLVQPVLIDPLTATVHRLELAQRQNDIWTIKAPLADYPLLVTDRRII